jgi:hypothetical protein
MAGPAKHVHTHSVSSAATMPTTSKPQLSIWFFVGALCLTYGLVLLPVGIYQLRHPPSIVLVGLHATLYWGVLMTLFGAFYVTRFRPRR